MLNIKLSLLTALIVFSSCEKIIDQQPQTVLSAETAYTTRQGVEAGLLGCYNALQSTSYYGLEFWALSDMYAGVIRTLVYSQHLRSLPIDRFFQTIPTLQVFGM